MVHITLTNGQDGPYHITICPYHMFRYHIIPCQVVHMIWIIFYDHAEAISMLVTSVGDEICW